ncbi:MAG: hypothetical protein JST00_35930 [Deltaproteobacteria bacterium]|nr:hypothetical protein [Deltaproteobacteria bacterium]
MSFVRSVLSSALASAMLLCGVPARAEGGAVVVIGGGPPFRDAIGVSLSAWNLRVVSVDGAVPRPQMPAAADEARAIAQREGAAGVVWVSLEKNESSLWVFDASTDQLVTRRLGATPPFDPPTAASAALTVKSLLRASTVAPPAERLGAVASPAPAPEPAPAPQEPQRPEHGERATPLEGRLPPGLRAEIGGAARVVASDIDTRGALGLGVWLGEQRRVGLGASVSFGPGLGIAEDRFRGRFSEVGVAPSARLRIPIGSTFAFEPRLGMALHLTTIDGVAVLTSRAASRSRVDASLDAGAVLDVVATPTLTLGLDVGISVMLRYQRYLVESVSVLDLAPVQGSLGLRLTTSLL